jgi:tRNA modification GTPase
MVFGRFLDVSRETIDQGLGVFMPGPSSYTGEDSVELYLHGGAAVIEHALDTLCGFAGTRLAEPGEFTRRAFENGQLDLVEAEGVADLIDAETRAQKSLALDQLDGQLSTAYAGWRLNMLEILSLLEASIDFPDEEDAPGEITDAVVQRLDETIHALELALADEGIGERIRDGFRIAITGPPNAGKSSILNRLAKREAAIVSNIPGTTRDVVEVRLKIGGQVAWIADTAGLRDAADEIEAEGVRRAKARAVDADIRVHVRSPDTGLEFGDTAPGDILVFNKSDLITDEDLPKGTLVLSATSGDGLIGLEEQLAGRVQAMAGGVPAPLITRRRHRDALRQSLFHVKRAQSAIENGYGAELVAEDARLAAQYVSNLIGQIGVEDILGEVFSTFCIGK